MFNHGGRLNRRVNIVSHGTIKDSHGWSHPGDIILYKNVPANISPLQGQEYLESQKYLDKSIVKILIRYHAGITPKCSIVYKSTEYNIESVVDEDMSHRWMLLYCTVKERGTNGA